MSSLASSSSTTVASPRSGSSQISGCNANHVDSIGSGGGQDDDPEVTEVPPPPPPDVEYGSENEGQLPWEDKMVKAMQRDISAVLMSRLSSGLAASVRNAVGSTSVLSFVWVPLLSTRFRRGCCRRFMERHCSPFQFAMNALHLNIMLAEKKEEQGYSRGE